MHQGSAISPLLYVIVMEALSKEIQSCLTMGNAVCRIADDLVVRVENEDDLIKRLNEWKDTHKHTHTHNPLGFCLGLPR